MSRFLAHLDRGWDMVTKGDTTRAFVAARNALDLDDESAEVHNLLGYVYAMDGDLEQALAHYRKSMDLDELYLDPILNAAEILVHSDSDSEEAINLCRRIADLAVDSEELTEAVLLEINALLNLGRVDEARERLDDIENKEDLPIPYALLVTRVLYDMGDLEAAQKQANAICARDRSNADGWYYQGLIARDMGQRIAAVKAFLQTRSLDLKIPDPPWAKQLDSMDRIVQKAIDALDPEVRAMLDGTEVKIVPVPSARQVRDEVEPRQVALAEGIDSERGTFEKLWIFYSNLVKAGVSPQTIGAELAQIILHELTDSAAAAEKTTV